MTECIGDAGRQNGCNTLYSDARFVRYYEMVRAAEREHELMAPYLRKTDQVLDIGCGTGELALSLHRMVRSVLGLDLSSAMIAAAEARRIRIGVGNVTFVQGDMLTMAQNETFDCAILGNAVLSEVADSSSMVSFIRRVHGWLGSDSRLIMTNAVFSPALLCDSCSAGTILDPETGHRISVLYEGNKVDVDSGMWSTTIAFKDARTGQIDRFPFHLNFIYRKELVFLLSLGGFCIEHEAVYQQGAMRLIICRKKELPNL